MPEQRLFWIMDDLHGGPRLLDMAEFEILQVQDAKAKEDSAEAPSTV